MLATEKPRHDHRWLVAAGLIPILLCLMFTLLLAGQMVKRQLAVTSSMLISQAENISDRARVMTTALQSYKNRRCADIKDELQELGSVHPYFRSVGLIQDDSVVCSSTFGERRDSVETILGRPLPPARQDLWSLSVAGTSRVNNRPAVLFMHQGRDGFASYALVDGQYLIDFIWAAGIRHDYDISMKFGDGFAMFSGVPATRQMENKWGNYTLNTHSDRYAINLNVTSARSELLYNWRQVLFSLMPMALILSLLFVVLTSNWLKRKSSFRDEIRRGIARNEFSVYYQPIFNLETQKFNGAEALLRWQRPDGHWIRPDVFIAAAESEGMIVPLTRHLLQRVIRDSAGWQLDPGFRVSVNLAADHLQHDGFLTDIRAFAAGMDRFKHKITLELTERSLINEDRMVSRRLAELRREGVNIAIDDFGTGHCALSYLQTFPLDYLKIDRGFVNTIESVDGETPVLDAIIALADKLGLKVVAEGVENEMQLRYLQNRGVSFIQGYYFARPMESAALSGWLQKHNDNGPQTSP
ncbi:EAL domain-containing protein [Erwiniaceae bacterium CAU 1747]